MRTGTHNLGRNRFGHMGLIKVEDDKVTLLSGAVRIELSIEQAQLLKDVL